MHRRFRQKKLQVKYVAISKEKESKDFDIERVMQVIRDVVCEKKISCVPRGDLVNSLRPILKLSKRRTDAEFWALFKDLTTKPQENIPLDKMLGMIKIGNMEYFYPLEMIRIYILVKKLSRFPGLIFYLMDRDAIADDSVHMYTMEKWEYVMRGNTSMFKAELKGVKTEKTEEEFIPLKLAGHTPKPHGQPIIEVIDFEINNSTATQLPKASMVAETLHKKIYHLKLKEPLVVGDKFTLRFQCGWPGQLTASTSYIFTPAIHLHRGVQREVTKVVSDRPITGVTVQKFDISSGELRLCRKSTKKLEKQPAKTKTLEKRNQTRSEVYIISLARKESSE